MLRKSARPIGWGWSVRALAGFIGLGLAYSSTPPAVHAQAGTQGQWRTLGTLMPINPVHAALMNNGKVLIVSGSGNVATETNFRYAVLDPVSEHVDVTQSQPWDMFCNGMVVLYDGRPFVVGGNLKYDPFWGQPKSSIFDPTSGVFADVQNMAKGRWYPTVTTLGDGRVMTFSGLDETSSTNSTVEIYTVGSGWSVPYAAGWTPPLYPRMHLLPDGNVIYTGSGTGTRIFNPTTHTWGSVIATTNSSVTRTYGTSVLLPLRASESYKARIMILGGGNPAINTTETIDMSAATPRWTVGPSMSQARIEMNATILPNGQVLATGGSASDEQETTKSLNADLFNTAGGTVTGPVSAGANGYARLYHSNALLLPDATVLLLGGNPARGTYEQHMEIYSPAYLFDSTGAAAVRPVITANPGPISYGTSFQIQTPNATDIKSVVLIRPGAPTHAFDMEQRMIELPYSVVGGQLSATVPSNTNIAPPGYYMLFIVNTAGVPSVASFVRLPPQVNQAPAITSGNSATFTVGAAGSFTVTTTGVPTSSVSESGALPAGVTFVSNGNGTATLSGTPAAGTAGTYAITITASNGVTPAATQAFTLTVNAAANQAPSATIISPASNLTVNPGDTVSFSGSGSDSDGTIASYAWTFAGGSPASSSVAAPGNVTYATPGTYQASLKVTDNGGLSSTAATRTITVADFAVGATPSSGSTLQGGSVPYTATVTGASGFSGVVALAATGAPTGVNASFSPASVTGSGSSTLTVTTSSTTPAGTYTLTVRGTSGTVTRSSTVTLVVTPAGDFSISGDASQTIQNGGNGTYSLTITPSGGFNSAVSLSVGTLPKFVTASFSPASITPSGSSVLTLSTKKQTKAGTYTVTVTGTSGTLVRSFDVTLVVQ